MKATVSGSASGASSAVVDDAWFEQSVVALLPELFGTARRLAPERDDAEDLVAETVARAWAARATLRDPGALRGWLARILANAFGARLRARAARPIEEPLDDDADFSLFERLHQPFLLWWGNPEQEFLDRLVRADIERAMDALPDVYRATVVLVELQGFSYGDVADTLGIPIGTVRSRLARGRALLQKALWKHAVDAGIARSPEPDQNA